MKTTRIIIPLFLFLLLVSTPPLSLADSATGEMAQILIHLNHRPSSDEKQELRKIANSDHASKGERALATALLNMDHKVTAADRERLGELARDGTASTAERELADILMRLHHKASAEDKERLRRLR